MPTSSRHTTDTPFLVWLVLGSRSSRSGVVAKEIERCQEYRGFLGIVPLQ